VLTLIVSNLESCNGSSAVTVVVISINVGPFTGNVFSRAAFLSRCAIAYRFIPSILFSIPATPNNTATVHLKMSSTAGLLEKGEQEEAQDSSDNSRITAWQALGYLIHTLRPTILTRTNSRVKTKLRRTAYLDGLRGFAAFLVYILHHELWAHGPLDGDVRFQAGFGYHGDRYFMALPFVRTFFSGGHLAVVIFFVLSGYVLSTKPLSLIHSGDLLTFGDVLASSFFRRWFRLFLPLIAVTLGIATFYHLTGIYIQFTPESTYRAELWKWYTDFKNFSFWYAHNVVPWNIYHTHTWTLPVELRGSVLVWITLSAVSRMTRNARLLCEVTLIWYFMYVVDGAFYSMFMLGVLLSDLDQLEISGNLPSFFSYFKSWWGTHLWFFTFLLGVYLGGVPTTEENISFLRENPGWLWMSYLKPQAVFDYKHFYLFWAAVMIVPAVPRISWLKRFFESNFCQYLGKISFMLYLVHGPILWTLGDRMYAAVGWSKEEHALLIPSWSGILLLPRWGPMGLEFSFLCTQVILLPVTLWIAEITTNVLDTPSIKVGNWLYRMMLPAGGDL